MEAQFNFQLRHRNDKREWEEIEVYYQTIPFCRFGVLTETTKGNGKK